MTRVSSPHEWMSMHNALSLLSYKSKGMDILNFEILLSKKALESPLLTDIRLLLSRINCQKSQK